MGELNFAKEVGGPMLKRLKGANQGAELLPSFEVSEGSLKNFLTDSEKLSGDCDRTSFIDCVENLGPFIENADQSSGLDGKVIELKLCGISAVDHLGSRDRDALSSRVHHEQRNPVSVSGLSVSSRCDDESICSAGIPDPGFSSR